LSLWTYPSPTNADGKELCDLLVVFRDTVIIFSDKDCDFQEDSNIEKAWDRWYKKAIIKSAKQIYGAEKELKRNSDKIFLDSKRQKPFPLAIPTNNEMRIYRVAVARGAKDACIKFFDGGSGSFVERVFKRYPEGMPITQEMINEFLKELEPFIVSQLKSLDDRQSVGEFSLSQLYWR